ncbi:MAG: AAA family ATPase [Gemmatimonadota bacterium]
MVYAFDEYEIDTRRLELRRAAEACHVEPQVFDVLCYLVRHRDRLVSRRELLERVWGHAFVTETTLNSRLMSARRAIGDSGRAQRLIRTIHGRGYRFVGEVEERYPEPVTPGGAAAAAVPPASSAPRLPGREGPLHELQRLLDATLHGARRIAFVSGETGIGKTTLIESFLAGASAHGGIGTALGQCLDQRGAGEPFLPVLEALGRLCRAPGGGALAALLDRRAPTWLAQMPGLVEPEEAASLQERIRGATRERMLRELVDALEAWTAEQPLVLVIEDLHWSDPSTLQLIDCLARRREPARLLLVGTFRPAEVRTGGHPLQTLVQELRVRDRCTELVLSPLSGATVAEYLEQRFPGFAPPAELHRLLHARTEGNPLFVRCLVDAWVARGAFAPCEGGWELRGALSDLAEDVPETLRRLIQQQVETLDPEDQAVLEAGSVEGLRFSAAAAAAGLDRPVARVEERCDYLARHGRFLRSCGVEEWPDGTVSGRYAFVHHLHRDVVYERVSGGRRAGLHRGIGERLETAYGARAGARTAELALHFAEGRDGVRAVDYRVRAAEQALERSAHREAVDHLARALGLLRGHPDVPDAVRREITVLRMLGPALVAVPAEEALP